MKLEMLINFNAATMFDVGYGQEAPYRTVPQGF